MPARDKEQDSNLAGLGFSFAPVQIRPAASKTAGARRPASAEGQQQPGAKAVSFNLKQRRPGAGYSSPQLGLALANTRPPRPHSADGGAHPAQHAPGELRGSWPAPGPDGTAVESAVQLLQSLKRRPSSPGAQEQPAARAAGLARLKEAALARRKASSAEVSLSLPRTGEKLLIGQQEQHQTHPFEAQPEEDAVGEGSLQLLHDAEQLLAGCTAGAAGEPHRTASPRHMQLVSIPARRWGEDAGEGWEVADRAASPQSRILRPADILPRQGSSTKQHDHLAAEPGSIPAYHAAGAGYGVARDSFGGEEASYHRVHAILSTITYPASPLGQHGPSMQELDEGRPAAGAPAAAAVPASPAAGPGSAQAGGGVDLEAAPSTLQGALALLGLLCPEEEEGGAGETRAPPLPPRAVYVAPLWLKLRAAELVLATKQEAGRQEMRPLLVRLRHVRANLEFHKVSFSS
jgi:hypothetical protein